jgi:hypothetical protein
VKRPDQCLVIYELEAADFEDKIATIDQFGLNQLTTAQSIGVALPVQLISLQ